MLTAIGRIRSGRQTGSSRRKADIILYQTNQQKKQETLTLVILGLILAIVLLVSKFVLGINFSLMEKGSYITFGYHEIRGDSIWGMSFDSFSGSISADAKFPEGGKHRLLVHSKTESSPLELTVKCGETKETHPLVGPQLDLTVPCDSDRFTMTISGNEVLSGYFSAVWE